MELLGLVLGGSQPVERALTLLNDVGGLTALDRAHPQQLRRTDDGCGCSTNAPPDGLTVLLPPLGLLGLRRRSPSQAIG